MGGLLAATALLILAASLALSRRGRDASPAAPEAYSSSTTASPGGDARAVDARRDEARVATVRGRVRAALETLEARDPPADAALGMLLGARAFVRKGSEDLERMSGELPRPDAMVTMLVARGKGLAGDLGRRIEEAGERLASRPISNARTFLDTGHFERASKVLSEMPAGLEETSWGDRWRTECALVAERWRAHRIEQARRRDEGWDYLFTGESLTGWRSIGGARLELVEDEIGYRILDVRGSGRADGDADVAYVPTGGERWKAYKIRFDVRGAEGDLVIYARAPKDGKDASGIRVPHDRLPRTDRWWTVLIEVDGGLFRVYLDSRKMGEAGATRGIAGGFGLSLRAEGRVQLRNVRVRVLR